MHAPTLRRIAEETGEVLPRPHRRASPKTSATQVAVSRQWRSETFGTCRSSFFCWSGCCAPSGSTGGALAWPDSRLRQRTHWVTLHSQPDHCRYWHCARSVCVGGIAQDVFGRRSRRLSFDSSACRMIASSRSRACDTVSKCGRERRGHDYPRAERNFSRICRRLPSSNRIWMAATFLRSMIESCTPTRSPTCRNLASGK